MQRLGAEWAAGGVSLRPSCIRGSGRIQAWASDLRFGPLIAQSPSVEMPTDDCFVPIHCGFDQAPAVVARAALPADETGHGILWRRLSLNLYGIAVPELRRWVGHPTILRSSLASRPFLSSGCGIA